MKKFLCLCAAALLLLGFAACGKSGDGSASPTDVGSSSPTDIEMPEATQTPEPQPVSQLSVCGIPIVTDGQPTGIGYSGADYENGVLTLDGLNIVSDYGSYPAISFAGDLQIVVTGDNTVETQNGVSAIVGGQEGDAASSTLTVTGDGTLTVTSDADTAVFCTGAVTVDGPALSLSGAAQALGGFAGSGEQLVLGEGMTASAGTGGQLTVAPENAAG